MYRGLTKYSYPDLQLEINVNRTGNVLNKLESILCWGCLMPIYMAMMLGTFKKHIVGLDVLL